MGQVRTLVAVHIKHAMAPNGTDVHRNLPKNYLKLGNNYGIWFRVRLGLGLCASKSAENHRKLGNNYGIRYRI